MRKLLNYLSVFTLLLIFLMPLPNIAWVPAFAEILLKDIVKFFADIVTVKMTVLDFSSDSVSLFLMVIFLLIISLPAIFIKKDFDKITKLGRIVSCYYLIFIFLSYGFNKLFGYQFPKPEANILYSYFGFLEKDILYWSVLGLSPLYTITLGIIECGIAILLFFKRTRLLGLISAFCSLCYILLVNISFDISVKLFTSLLLVMVLYQVLFYWSTLTALVKVLFQTKEISNQKPLKLAIKSFVFLAMIGVLCVPYVIDKNQNQEFQGAFYLERIESLENATTHQNWKKIFFLKQGYVVFQTDSGKMIDYELLQFNHQLILQKQHDILKLAVLNKSKNAVVLRLAQNTYYFKRLAVEKLPVNQHKNHLFIDYVR